MRFTTVILLFLTVVCVAVAESKTTPVRRERQDVYVLAPAGGIMRLSLNPGPNLIQSSTAIPIQVVIGDLLLADVDTAKGDAAVAACNAGDIPKPVPAGAAGFGVTPDCKYAWKIAVDADIFARVKAVIATIPAATLIAQKLRPIR